MTKRRKDWLKRLEAYVRASHGREFVIGEFDCGLWVAGAVEAMTGKDPIADLRAAYRTEDEGRALVASKGFRDHVEVAAARLTEIPVGHAEPGDVVVVDGEAMGIVQGRFAWVMTERGLGAVPMERAGRAFRVGD